MFKGIRIWGVLAGLIADIVVSLTLQMVFVLMILIILAVKDHGNWGSVVTESNTVTENVWARIFGDLIGCSGSFIGGFIASWIGSAARMKNVVGIAIMEVVFNLVALVAFPILYEPPVWLTVFDIVIGIPAIFLGGLLAKKIL
jgi:hypothetical protein